MKNAKANKTFEKAWKKWNRIEDQLLQKELRKFNSLSYASNPKFYKILYCKIINRNPLRAKFIFILYLYLKNETKKDFLFSNFINLIISFLSFFSKKNTSIPKSFFYRQFPFILEVIISIQYYHNQILDGKSEVYTTDAINKNLIKGNLLKDQLYRYIETIKLSNEQKAQLIQSVRNIFELVDLGQYIEKKLNTHSSFEEIIKTGHFKPPFQKHIMHFIDQGLMEKVIDQVKETISLDESHTAFLRLYLYRIFLTNTSLFSLSTELLTCFLKVEKKKKNNLVKYSTLFGIMLQMVNDNTDFIPARFEEETRAKFAGDAFSDLRNCNVTLPLIIYLFRTPENAGEIRRFLINQSKELNLSEKKFSPLEERIYFDEILKSHSIFYSMSIPKEIKKWSSSFLNPSNPVTPHLEELLTLVDNNRYYRYFYEQEKRKYYKEYKKIKDQHLTAAG